MSNKQSQDGVPVLLLKTKSTPHDGYEEYFSNPSTGSFCPTFVPVLEHRFQQDALQVVKSKIETKGSFADESGDVQQPFYGGIIFTSQRAVEAFSEVVTDIRTNGSQLSPQLSPDTPLYVVGPATARGLRALNLPCPIVGEETGNGEALAACIQKDYWERARGRGTAGENATLPLLFLVGEQRRDIIPRTLSSETLPAGQRIEVVELVVYETGEMHSFRESFRSIWSTNVERNVPEQWIIIFSPAGCRATLETLGLIDLQTGRANTQLLPPHNTHIATIGPTTRDFLMKEFGFRPDVCALKPSPQGVGEGIREYTQQRARVHGIEQNFATQIT